MSDLNCRDNCIEWLNGDNEAYFTFSQKKYINRVEKLSKKYPQNCTVLRRNSDGSVYGKIRTRAIVLNQTALKYIGELNDMEGEDDEEDVEGEGGV